LLASKVIEVHFPSIKSILGALDFFTSKSELIELEQDILALFGFELALERNSYSILHEFFGVETE
jgi:hypothetical protein